jgi:ppGpp synthetase/RelA/SpoT-type nucleotidyltranferase
MELDFSTLSQKQINKIGKKFRDSIQDEADFEILEEFKKSYDDLLIEYTTKISRDLNDIGTNYVMAGRLKRTSSIIRKLQRPQNKGMDLTRMSDIAGTRVIVKSLEDQRKIVDVLKEKYTVEKYYDYVESDQNYKSIHLVLKEEPYKFIEVQIRTLAQQTWADESEEFGEQAKQGLYPEIVKDYLTLLSTIMYKIDKGIEISLSKIDNHFFEQKSPVKGKFNIIKKEFQKNFDFYEKPNYLLIVYDKYDSTLVSKDIFDIKDKDKIFDLYRYKSKILEESQFEIIFFVSNLGENVLRVSHPRFFLR